MAAGSGGTAAGSGWQGCARLVELLEDAVGVAGGGDGMGFLEQG